MTDLSGKQEQIEPAIHILLLFHVGFFSAQACKYLIYGYYIDPLSGVTGEASRYLAESITMSTSVFSMRPTGLYQEPSNYAAHILPLALLYYIRKDRLTQLEQWHEKDRFVTAGYAGRASC